MMLRRLAAMAACVLAACSLVRPHPGSAPQRFITALMHGNGMEASHIWLQMTPAERERLAHSEGLRPQISRAALEAELLQHTVSPDQAGEVEQPFVLPKAAASPFELPSPPPVSEIRQIE